MSCHTAIALGALAFLVACSSEPPAKTPTQTPDEEAAPHSTGGRVVLSPAAVSGLGLRTAPAERRALGATIRATAVIRANDNRLAHVSPRISGKAVEVKAVLGGRVEGRQVRAASPSSTRW